MWYAVRDAPCRVFQSNLREKPVKNEKNLQYFSFLPKESPASRAEKPFE